MNAGQFAFCLLVLGAPRAPAASFVSGEATPGTVAILPPAAGPAVPLLPRELPLSVSPPMDGLARAADAPDVPAPAGAASDEPTDEDAQEAILAGILLNPTLPPRVAKLIERELGLNADHPLFEHISRSGGQARNANTNQPIGEPHPAVNPAREIAGLFNLRRESPAYYRSLKNPKTGVVATGVRGGVDKMVDDLLEKGYIPPRSSGRNLSFRNGVYMDLPSYIHQARSFAAVDPNRTEGKTRYPLVVSFRAGDVHNPGSEHEGRIMGDGGTLGQVALDRVTPSDIVSIYVPQDRVAQTAARLKGTALAHVPVLLMDILPEH